MTKILPMITNLHYTIVPYPPITVASSLNNSTTEATLDYATTTLKTTGTALINWASKISPILSLLNMHFNNTSLNTPRTRHSSGALNPSTNVQVHNIPKWHAQWKAPKKARQHRQNWLIIPEILRCKYSPDMVVPAGGTRKTRKKIHLGVLAYVQYNRPDQDKNTARGRRDNNARDINQGSAAKTPIGRNKYPNPSRDSSADDIAAAPPRESFSRFAIHQRQRETHYFCRGRGLERSRLQGNYGNVFVCFHFDS